MSLATAEELKQYPPPPLPRWIQRPDKYGFPQAREPLLPSPEYQIQLLDAKGKPYFASNYGPQTWGLVCPYSEIVVGGSRGGGKSAMLIAWFVMGYPFLEDGDPAKYMAIYEPSYRGLMLRKEYQSMAEFVDEAWDFYGPLGAKKKDDPVEFTFKSGAKIYTNHLGDNSAFEKYRGWGISRIGIEELTQIEEERSYIKLLGSLRAKRQFRIHNGKKFAALPSQIMSTTNPDGPGACVPYGDVLTPHGWRDIKTIQPGDIVWSIDPHDGRMVERTVDQVHAQQFSGELCEAEGRGLSMVCTPNHKILRFNTTKNDRNTLRLQAIEDCPGQVVVLRTALKWDGYGPATVSVKPSARRKRKCKGPDQPLELPVEKFAALVGWMVTEGSLVIRDNAISISQVKAEGKAQIKELLDDCGFVQHWGKKGVLIYSHEWLEAFSWLPHAHNKYIPQWIKDLPAFALQALFDAMVAGDGHAASAWSGGFYSSSPRLISDFCEVALKLGYMILSSHRDRNGSVSKIADHPFDGKLALSHEVQYHRQALNGSEIRTGNHKYRVGTSTKRLNVKRVPFSGSVYCIGVRGTHTFILRQNGCVWISGNSWVKKRFIKVHDSNGGYVKWNHPMKDVFTKGVRIFIPMSRKENPYLRDNAEYESNLLAQDEITRRQWMDGLWESAGQFFTEWRPDGPVGKEEQEKYPWARHVIESAPLRDYWFRWGSGDWGFNHPAVFHKCCRSDKDGRIHFYDELTLRQCGSFEMGVLLAKWWLPELEGLPDKSITISFSPDAFSKTDATRTKAEQIADGIKSVLGPYGAFLLKYSDDERTVMARDPSAAQRMFDQRRAQAAQGQFCIVLKAANTDRVAGWSYMRELLRFRPVVQETEAQLKERLKKTFERGGVEAYERELSKVKRVEEKVLPRLQVWKRCSGLIRCMEEAMQREEKPEDVQVFNSVDGVGGDDPLDSGRYAAIGFKDIENVIPKSYYVAEQMERIQEDFEVQTGERLTDQTRLAMVQQRQSARYDVAHPSTGGQLYIPRAGSSRHRHPQQRVN